MATKCRMIELYSAFRVFKTDDTESRPDLATITVDSLEVDIKPDRVTITAGKSGTERKYTYSGAYLVYE